MMLLRGSRCRRIRRAHAGEIEQNAAKPLCGFRFLGCGAGQGVCPGLPWHSWCTWVGWQEPGSRWGSCGRDSVKRPLEGSFERWRLEEDLTCTRMPAGAQRPSRKHRLQTPSLSRGPGLCEAPEAVPGEAGSSKTARCTDFMWFCPLPPAAGPSSAVCPHRPPVRASMSFPEENETQKSKTNPRQGVSELLARHASCDCKPLPLRTLGWYGHC